MSNIRNFTLRAKLEDWWWNPDEVGKDKIVREFQMIIGAIVSNPYTNIQVLLFEEKNRDGKRFHIFTMWGHEAVSHNYLQWIIDVVEDVGGIFTKVFCEDTDNGIVEEFRVNM